MSYCLGGYAQKVLVFIQYILHCNYQQTNLSVVTSVIPVCAGRGGAGWLVTGRGCRVRSGACGGAMESLTMGEGPAVGRPEEMGSNRWLEVVITSVFDASKQS